MLINHTKESLPRTLQETETETGVETKERRSISDTPIGSIDLVSSSVENGILHAYHIPSQSLSQQEQLIARAMLEQFNSKNGGIKGITISKKLF